MMRTGLYFYGSTQKLVGNDRVAAVNDSGVVTALIEHTHIDAEHVGEVYGTRSIASSSG